MSKAPEKIKPVESRDTLIEGRDHYRKEANGAYHQIGELMIALYGAKQEVRELKTSRDLQVTLRRSAENLANASEIQYSRSTEVFESRLRMSTSNVDSYENAVVAGLFGLLLSTAMLMANVVPNDWVAPWWLLASLPIAMFSITRLFTRP